MKYSYEKVCPAQFPVVFYSFHKLKKNLSTYREKVRIIKFLYIKEDKLYLAFTVNV
jgi:hypothetical protein